MSFSKIDLEKIKNKILLSGEIGKKAGLIEKMTKATVGKMPLLEKLPPLVQQQLLVGGITAGASALYDHFAGTFREKLPEETMEEFLEARRKRVGIQMRNYMDLLMAYVIKLG